MTGQELFGMLWSNDTLTSNDVRFDELSRQRKNTWNKVAAKLELLPVKTPGEVLWDSFARSESYNWSKATLTIKDEYEKAAQAVLDHAKENS